jgi:hypothetical protein
MFHKISVPNSSVDSSNFKEAHKIALTTAWTLISDKLSDHSRNIFAEFYEQNPNYLSLFYDLGNEILHKHSEEVLKSLGKLIDCLHDSETFHHELQRISKSHKHMTRKDIEKLNKTIKSYILQQVSKHKTKTLEEALKILFNQIESRFDDPSDLNDEEM